jgi:hypothetical protein
VRLIFALGAKRPIHLVLQHAKQRDLSARRQRIHFVEEERSPFGLGE